MKKLAVIIGILFFGFFLVSLIYFNPDLKKPFSIFSSEKMSPGDWLDAKQIKVLNGFVIIKAENLTLSSFADTNSMDPLLDHEANGLEIKPQKNKLKVGDIISYKSNFLSGTIIHRIVEINEDSQGTYYLVKGDNNAVQDPEKVRFDQIEGVLIGILY